MSRRRRKVIERAYRPTASPAMGIQGDYAKYAGGNSVTIPATVLSKMLQNLAPQGNQAKDFAPGSPLMPYQGVVPVGGPRIWSFAPGINIQANDRTLGMQDVPSFAQLRNLAMLFSGVSLCERVILDMIPKLVPKVVLRKDLSEDGAQEKDYQAEIKQWMKFVEMPDPAQKMDIHTWLRMAWIEQTQIDALAIYKQKTRGGKLMGLQVISGDTVKPLLDERGMIPQPPYPAYQQYPYGVPGDQYTTDQMIYYRESPRAFTPYGFSRVERIIMEVNQALRKKQKDLASWTEGNIPAGIMEVPDTSQWTPDQIDAFEQMWNSLLAGNPQQQVRIKFTQPGMKYQPFEQYDLQPTFDEFLLNISAAAYGLSMQDLAFTGDIHKSSGDSQQNVMFRRTLAPLINVYACILTNLLAEAFHDDRFIVTMGGFDETEDLQSQATAYSLLIQNAVISPAGVARLMHLPEVPETGPFILPKGGQPLFLEQLSDSKFRSALQDSMLESMQYTEQSEEEAVQQSGAPQGTESNLSDEDEEEEEDQITSNGSNGKQSRARGSGSVPIERQITAILMRLEHLDQYFKGKEVHDESRASSNDGKPKDHSNDHRRGNSEIAEVGSRESPACSLSQGDGADTREITAEYRRWRKRAIEDVKAGKAQRGFTTLVIPEEAHRQISAALPHCTTADEIHEIFRKAQQPELHWQDTDEGIVRGIASLKATGVKTITWKAYMGACSECAVNDGQTVALGSRFKSGAYLVPSHNHCVCEFTDGQGKRYTWTGVDGEYKSYEESKV